MKDKCILTAESVTEGHPDKLCDTIADAVLDACLEHDSSARVACEVMATAGKIIVAGEITAKELPDIPSIVCDTVKRIGYTCDFDVEVRVHALWRVLVLVFHGIRERFRRQALQIRKKHHNKLSAVMYQAFQPFIFFSEGIRSALDHSDFLRHLLHLLGFGRLRNRQPQVVFPYTDFPPHPHHAADK